MIKIFFGPQTYRIAGIIFFFGGGGGGGAKFSWMLGFVVIHGKKIVDGL